MASRIPGPLHDILSKVDEAAVGTWFRLVSLPTDRIRAQLRFRGHPFVDPAKPPPTLDELERTARAVITRSAGNASAVSGMAGLGGMFSIPPELAALLVASIRLGQRLAVVYGFDPETDKGQMALSRALAAAYGVELPSAGPVGLKLSRLPAVVANRRPETQGTVTGNLAKAMVRFGVTNTMSRYLRFIPVLAAGVSAADGRRSMEHVGLRMQIVLARLAEVPLSGHGAIEDAVEL